MKKRLAIMMVLVMSMALLASCGGNSLTPSETVDGYLQGVKAHKDNLDEYFVNDDEEDAEILDEIADEDSEYFRAKDKEGKNIVQRLSEFEYKIGKETINGDKAEVELVITTYDYSELMNIFMSKAETELYELAQTNVNEEVMEKAVIRLFSESMDQIPLEKKDYNATLKLTKVKEEWKLDSLAFNEEFLNAVSGGLYDSINQLGGLDD